MLNLFRRRDEGSGSQTEGPPGSSLPSHILTKFVKRLQAMSKPDLLDLGRVSGANIEFFARAGCRVRVEDLLNPEADPSGTDGDEEPGREPTAITEGTDSPSRRTDLP